MQKKIRSSKFKKKFALFNIKYFYKNKKWTEQCKALSVYVYSKIYYIEDEIL